MLNPLAGAIRALKYRQRRDVAATLGALLAERWPFGDDAVLVPVPPSSARLRARGHDHVLLLARVLARRARLRLAPGALRRVHPTATQVRLDAGARRHNLAGAFAVQHREAIRGRRVVLVDDVLTTGATADACAAVLAAAGAERVDVFTVGRAPHP
jgi:ComF family protein